MPEGGGRQKKGYRRNKYCSRESKNSVCACCGDAFATVYVEQFNWFLIITAVLYVKYTISRSNRFTTER